VSLLSVVDYMEVSHTLAQNHIGEIVFARNTLALRWQILTKFRPVNQHSQDVDENVRCM
jgi:hypothetical protein